MHLWFALTDSSFRKKAQEIILNTQQITEALAKVTQLHRLPQARPDVFRGEEEDKTKFFLWESAFDALIDSVPVAPR